MLSRILPLLLILFSGLARAYDFPIEVIEFIDDAKVVAFVDETDIDEALDWTPFEGSPPLTIAGALAAIREHIATDKNLADATFAEIELKQLPNHPKHWHYLVKMRSQESDAPHSIFFIVLMNGKVITGIREPQSLK